MATNKRKPAQAVTEDWKTEVRADLERDYPYVAYDGAIGQDEDWADYRSFSVKGVRL